MNNIEFKKAYTSLTDKLHYFDRRIEMYHDVHSDEDYKDLKWLQNNRKMYSKLQNILLEKFGKEGLA